MDLSEFSALKIAEMVKGRRLSPLEVVRWTADAIAERNPAVNAVVSLRVEPALREAEGLERRIMKGEDLGLLLGVPFLVKDLEPVAGLPTTYGSVAYRQNIAKEDSIQVQRLKQQGAIVVGKTNTPEFGFTGFTKNRLFGVTRNPWDLSKTPGGSSGGSAAAVTAGMVPIATGSDAGGSIRIPASYCGCVGLKPTFGRIPFGPDFMGFGSHLWTLGPLCRYVEDAWIFLKATSGYHPADPHSGLRDLEIGDTLAPLKGPLRILYSPNLGGYPVEKEVKEKVDHVMEVCERLGHRVEEIGDRFVDVERTWWVYMGLDLAFQLGEGLIQNRPLLNRAMVKTIEDVLEIRLSELTDLRRIRGELFLQIQGLFRRADILATPTTPTVAFGAEGPPPETIEGQVVRLLDVVAFTYPFNLTGHPAVSIRAGLNSNGLPVGVQFVGPMLREDLILRLAWELQEEMGLHRSWPTLKVTGGF